MSAGQADDAARIKRSRWVAAAAGWCAAGTAITVALWVALVPWDLSEVNTQGVRVAGGDDYAPQIALVLIIASVAWIGLAFFAKHLPIVPVACCSAATWVVLWSWRASVSRVVGGNLWMVGLIMVVLPAAALSVFLVGLAALVSHRKR